MTVNVAFFCQGKPVCSKIQNSVCIASIIPNSTECLPNCDGVLVTSYFKTKNENDAEVVAPNLIEQYNKYKKLVKFPPKLEGT